MIALIISCIVLPHTTEAKKRGGFMGDLAKYRSGKKFLRAAVPLAAILSGVGEFLH